MSQAVLSTLHLMENNLLHSKISIKVCRNIQGAVQEQLFYLLLFFSFYKKVMITATPSVSSAMTVLAFCLLRPF